MTTWDTYDRVYTTLAFPNRAFHREVVTMRIEVNEAESCYDKYGESEPTFLLMGVCMTAPCIEWS